MYFNIIVALLLLSIADRSSAVGSCRFNGVSGTCLTRAQCSGTLTPYGTPGVDDGCKPYASDIKCCTATPSQTAAPSTTSGSIRCSVSGRAGVGTSTCTQSGYRHYAYGTAGVDAGCKNEPSYVRCCAPEPTTTRATTTARTTIRSTNAATTTLASGSTRCSVSGRAGLCTTTCAQSGYRHYAYGTAGVDAGCKNEPSYVRCCAPEPTTTRATTTTTTTAAGATTQPQDGNNQGPCESPYGASGQCRPTSTCASSLQSFPTSQGATGCQHIKAADVQCCAARPPPGAINPALPNGECELARPDSTCGAFTGRQMTINVRFIDEVQRIHAHARAAGVSIYVTDSFRVSAVSYGASKSRHKVGMAIDMNAGGCDSNCMCRLPTRIASVTTFLQRLVADRALHWGGDPSKPINWRVGSCSRDSVHIQSTTYLGSRDYYEEQRCLNTANSRGQFRRFSCTNGALLIDDVDVSNLDSIGVDSGLSSGAIAGIVLAALVCCVLLLVFVAACVLRSSASAAAADADTERGVSLNNAYYQVDATHSGVYEQQHGSSVAGDTYAVGYGASVAGYGAAAAGYGSQQQLYTCNICQKSYAVAADLAHHVAKRHA